MADSFAQTCFAFPCSAAEWSLLQGAFLLSLDLCAEIDPEPRSTAFMTLFPPDGEDHWAGFRDLFEDRAYPDFGADLAGGRAATGQVWQAIISAEVSFNPQAIANLIQRCCSGSLANGPIGFEWAITSSRQIVDGFGGGWGVIFSDRSVIQSTRRSLAMAIAGSSSKALKPAAWP